MEKELMLHQREQQILDWLKSKKKRESIANQVVNQLDEFWAEISEKASQEESITHNVKVDPTFDLLDEFDQPPVWERRETARWNYAQEEEKAY